MVKLWVTCAAGEYLPSRVPASFAAIVHGPAALRLTIAPLNAQVAGVNEVNVTGFPEPPPLALTV